jgi:hypothetical protein
LDAPFFTQLIEIKRRGLVDSLKDHSFLYINFYCYHAIKEKCFYPLGDWVNSIFKGHEEDIKIGLKGFMTEAAKYIDLCSLIVKNPRFFKFFTNICL